MDMIHIFHGSLTIEDKASSGTGNVRFSSSDTDISLSSSSIISSSSSMSLFSFDGVESTSLSTSNVVLPINNAVSHSDSREDLRTAVVTVGKENDSLLPDCPVILDCLHTEKMYATKNQITNEGNASNINSVNLEPTQNASISYDGDEPGKGQSITTNHSCGVDQSNLDDSTFQMNLKNLTQCESFCKELEKKKLDNTGYVICDLDPDNELTNLTKISNANLLDSVVMVADSNLTQEVIKPENATNCQSVFSLAESLTNYEESLVNAANEKMDVETSSRETGSSQISSDNSTISSHPNKRGRRVKFPSDDELITGYVFPAVPWKNPLECSTDELISSYLESCSKYDTPPSEIILSQLRVISDFTTRNELFSLKGVTIDWKVCETLETVFKRVRFHTMSLESTGLTEQTTMVMFDLLNYYEPCSRLILSSNNQMGIRGWQACGSYLRQSQTLSSFEARQSTIPEYSIAPVFRGIQTCSNLTSVHLQGSINSGRSLQLLASGLRGSKSIQDVYLGDNRFNPSDGLQLANLVKDNANLQLIDLRNNNLQDTGATYIFEALAQSSNCNLNTLIVWNNKLTKGSMSMLSKMLKTTKSLETINLGHNGITDEGIYRLKEGLIKNNSLLRIGLQAIKVTCEGVVALAESIVEHSRLEKLDLRGNRLKTAGLMALSQSLKVNKSVTCVAMDATQEDGDAEKGGNEDNQEEIKNQYIQEILSYTVRNSDFKHQSPVQTDDGSVTINEANSIQLVNDQLQSQEHDQRYELNSKPEVVVGRSEADLDEFDRTASDAKRHFQLRCQMLESPSIFNSDVPLFPSVGKFHGFERSNSIGSDQAKDATLSTSSPVLAKVSPPEDLRSSEASPSTKSPSEVSPSPPSIPVAPPCPHSKPLVSKRKFTVSKAILPSIFTKSGSFQQPSVLYTASSDAGPDGRIAVDGQDGHGDAKVRIIGIQSEEKENTTPLITSTNDANSSLAPPPP